MRTDEPVARIMTETVVVIEADRPVGEVRDCFLHYPFHHLPVVRDGRLVGMLSSADVMRLAHDEPDAVGGPAAQPGAPLRAEQLMHAPVASLAAQASLAEAAERLIETGVHALPVVDARDCVLGIVTTTDIMRCLLHGPPRRGAPPPERATRHAVPEDAAAEPAYHRRPAPDEYQVALRTAQVLHVEARDPRFLGKAMLYLDQRRAYLEKVLELADRFLRGGQDERTHALLLKAIYAAKRAEEHASGEARVPFPLQ
jgi:CBS domain-containing protein